MQTSNSIKVTTVVKASDAAVASQVSQNVFPSYIMCSLTRERVLLLEKEFSYYRPPMPQSRRRYHRISLHLKPHTLHRNPHTLHMLHPTPKSAVAWQVTLYVTKLQSLH